VLAEDPQVARLRDRSVGRRGNVVGINEAFGDVGLEDFRQVVGREAQAVDRVVRVLQLGQLDLQEAEVPLGQLARLVVRDPVGADLVGREVERDVDRHLLEAELLRGAEAGVAGDDHALGVHHDRLAEAEFLERRRHGGDRGIVVPRVGLVGRDLVDRDESNFHGLLTYPSLTIVCGKKCRETRPAARARWGAEVRTNPPYPHV
jgi:hypothetical protein